ncbi:MAG: ribosome assembly cofactor RimP [Flavobacteriaceae bacterium]|nr:ribosome assembly cofactor RimP [Flavobacteriaceae bacterium]
MSKIINKLIEEAISENEKLFLIKKDIDSESRISLVVDGEEGIPISECVRITRYIKKGLFDEDEEHGYSVNVSGPDITEAIVDIRQYLKNKGRTMAIKTSEGDFEGVLTKIEGQEIVLEWESREPKPIGKGKVTVKNTKTLVFADIVEAIVVIKFN